jgi:putative ABC transport system permease protein
MMDRIIADPDYLPTLGMEIAAGRNLSEDFPSDQSGAVLINEAAARKFGWSDAVGKTIARPDGSDPRRVVGVVRDFHFSSPHRLITPIIISYDEPRYRRNLFVRIRPENVPATLETLRETMGRFDPNRPFEYTFLDETYDRQYGAEEKLSTLFAVFTLLAIFIACLGLVGIASFSVERRKREIGIRKVLGASVPRIVLLLSRELALLSAVALLVAWPVAWLVMREWLEAFPLRTALDPLVFLAAGLLMLVIALATVSYHTVRAGRANPVEALRHS